MKINIAEIICLKVSHQPNAWSDIDYETDISTVLNEIKLGYHKEQINYLRNLLQIKNLIGYQKHKKDLPAVTFCASFDKIRKNSFLKSYNKLIIIDIDKLDSRELEELKIKLLKDDFIFAFWESPSRQGLKGLVLVKYLEDGFKSQIDYWHKIAFKKLSKYFEQNYNVSLDISGSDITRLCFLSFDPKLVLKPSCETFDISIEDVPDTVEQKVIKKEILKENKGRLDLLYNPTKKNNPKNRNKMQSILRYLKKRNISITYSYSSWIRVGFAIANSFTYDIGIKYFLALSEMDKDKFNKANCEKTLINCYHRQSGSISFRSIEYLAKQKGYKLFKKEEGSREGDTLQKVP